MPDPTYLLIPASVKVPVRIGQLTDGQAQIERLVGGHPDRGVYDHDATFWIHGNAIPEGMPLNLRATQYVINESASAQQGRMEGALESGWAICGAVVVMGSSDDGFTSVPDRLMEWFGARVQAAERAQTPPVRSRVVDHGLDN